MECLLSGETIEQVLMCVYSQVYWLSYTDEEIAAIKAGENPVQTDSEETTKSGDKPKEDYLTQLAAYLSHLAGEFASKVEEVEIGDVHVLVPRAETVRLRQARSNGVWLLSYDSILGEDNNPGRVVKSRVIRVSLTGGLPIKSWPPALTLVILRLFVNSFANRFRVVRTVILLAITSS